MKCSAIEAPVFLVEDDDIRDLAEGGTSRNGDLIACNTAQSRGRVIPERRGACSAEFDMRDR
jgi:hypothetical protein